jgi:hypothetical protein
MSSVDSSLSLRNPKSLTLEMEADNASYALSLDSSSDSNDKGTNHADNNNIDTESTTKNYPLKVCLCLLTAAYLPRLTLTGCLNSSQESETRPSVRCVLEDFMPCSKSHLWKLMMSFYDRKGPESWSEGIVPHFITCNTFIGKAYAKVSQQDHIDFFPYTILSRFCMGSYKIACVQVPRSNWM